MKQNENIANKGQPSGWWALLVLLGFLFHVSATAQSTNAPMNQNGGDLQVWYKADSGTGCVTANCPMISWTSSYTVPGYNAAGSGTSLNLAKYSFNPTVTSDTALNYLDFNLPVGNSMGFFVVFASRDSTDNGGLWYQQPSIFSCENTSGGNRDYGLTFNDGEFNWSHTSGDGVAIGSGAATNYADGLPRVIYVDRNGSNARMYINGVSIGTSNSFQTGNLNTSPKIALFRQPVGLAVQGPLLGDISEFLCYDVQVGNPGREQIETYLALRYGITLGHNYVNSSGATIYAMSGTYVNNVAGIGVQNNGRLNQRQSISSNPEGIVAIGNGTALALTNKLNGVNFAGDGAYLIWGDNGGGSCWGNNVKVAGAEGQHLKIERNWRMQKTNPANLVNTQLRLTANDPDFPINLPANSDSIIYLYLDSDDLFMNGGVVSKPMTFAAGYWTVALTQAEINANNYFSFGTKLDPVQSNQTQCTGVDFPVYGSFLAAPGSCAAIDIIGPQTFNLLEGPSPTNTTFYVQHDGAGECMDTLFLNLTGFSGVYDVFVARDSLAGVCPPPMPSGPARPYIALQQVTLVGGVAVDAGFGGGTTIEDEFVCSNASNLLITTNVGAVNYALYSSNTLVNINQLVMSGPDQVMVHQGTAGIHRILVSSPTNCGTDTLTIEIQQPVAGYFDYQYDPICLNLQDSIDTVNVSGGWFFLAAPTTGVTVDQYTGLLSTVAGTPGTYVISYQSSDTACIIASTSTVTVPAPDQQIFTYPSTDFCSSDANVLPIVTQYSNHPVGYYTVASVVGSGTMQVDSSNGQLLFNTVTAGDQFTIRFENSGAPCGLDHDFVVTVWDPLPFNFDYPSDTLCGSTGNVVPTLSAGVTNLVWTYDTANIDLNVTNGAINPQTSTPGGPYVIQVQGRFGPHNCLDVQRDTIWIDGSTNTMIVYPDSVYCRQGSADPVPLFLSGIAGGVFSSSNGVVFSNATTGQIDLGLTAANTPSTLYNIDYAVPNQTCPQSVTVTNNLLLVDPADPSFTIPTSVCRSLGSINISATQPLGGGYSIFRGDTLITTTNINNIPFAGLPHDGTYKLQRILNVSGVCSDTAFEFFTILRLEDPTFAYGPDSICESNVFLDPFIYGDGGGTFFDIAGGNTTIVDDSTGRIDLGQSNPGKHFIMYRTNGPCPDSTMDSVKVQAGYLADFSLSLSIVCESEDTLKMDTVFNVFPNVTRFYSDPTGLAINQLNGTIFPRLSTNLSGPTDFRIYHVTGGPGLCSDTSFADLTVQEYDSSLAFDYGTGPFCTADGVISPSYSIADTANAFFNQPVGLTYADTAGLGAIDLQFTRPGGYRIKLTINGVCGESTTDTITVLQSDNAFFTYGFNGICKSSSGTVLPSVTLTGGAFTGVPVISGDVLSLTATDGAIDVGQSSEGTYSITYTTNGTCPASYTENVTINPKPVINRTDIVPGLSICTNTPVSFNTNGAGGSFSWFRLAAPAAPSLLGIGSSLTDSTLQDGDSIALVIASPTTGCADTNYYEIEVSPPPIVTPAGTPGLLDGTGPFTVKLQVNQDGSWIQWWETTTLGTLALNDSITDTLSVNDIADITNTIRLASDYDPAIVTLVYQGVRNGCRGPLDTLSFPVNPATGLFFIAEVMTPNGDGKNDKWEIRYDGSVEPTDYYIELYNRAGGKVYTVERLNEEWFGGSNGDGVYWWMLYARSGGIIQSGGLTIRRN